MTTTARQASKRINQLHCQRKFFERAGVQNLLFNYTAAEYAPDAEILKAVDDYRQRRLDQIDAELAKLEDSGAPQ